MTGGGGRWADGGWKLGRSCCPAVFCCWSREVKRENEGADLLFLSEIKYGMSCLIFTIMIHI